MLRNRLGVLGLRTVWHSAIRAVVASVCCGVAARFVGSLHEWTGSSSFADGGWLAMAVLAGIATYASVALALGSPELHYVVRILRSRLGRIHRPK